MVKQLMSQREEVRAEANKECVKERALWTALPVPRAGESFCQLVGKVKQLETKLLSWLRVCVSARTTALFWVELDLCVCFVHQHWLLLRLGARKGAAPAAMLTMILPWGELSSGMPTRGGSVQQVCWLTAPWLWHYRCGTSVCRHALSQLWQAPQAGSSSFDEPCHWSRSSFRQCFSPSLALLCPVICHARGTEEWLSSFWLQPRCRQGVTHRCQVLLKTVRLRPSPWGRQNSLRQSKAHLEPSSPPSSKRFVGGLLCSCKGCC